MSYLQALNDNRSRLYENQRELKRLIDGKQARILELEDEIRVCHLALAAMRELCVQLSLEISAARPIEGENNVGL